MMDRRISIFFYGLYMDEVRLLQMGIRPPEKKPSYVDGYLLAIGKRATLVPSDTSRTYGMTMALTFSEISTLYSAPGLEEYRPEAVLVRDLQGNCTAALCYNLAAPPAASELNREYRDELCKLLSTLEFPAEYIARVRDEPAAR